jgi:cytosine/adenosine deaminase-related metal-dependent hydrolase
MSGLSYMKENGDIAQYYDEARGISGLKEAIRFIADFDRSSGGRIRGFLAPDRIETQTEEVLRRTADAANELDVPVRLHCCQSVYEFNTVMDRTGKTPYEWLNSLNLLTSRMVLPHGIYLSGRPDVNEGIGDDLDLLRRSGASLVHCPVVFARSGEALNSFSSYRSMGINIAMGTDTHPADMVENIRQGLNICHIMDRGSRRSTAADFYNAATLGGAAALGRDDIGRLAPGAKADITVYDLSGFHLGPFIDPIRSMILSGTGRDFVASIIDGVEVMRDGQVAGTNELELSILANRQFRKVITSHARQAGRPAEEDKITPSTFEIVRPPN